MVKKHIIIGAGSAGVNAAEEIRRRNSADRIILITKEVFPPYSPTALPYIISGKIDESLLPMRSEDYLAKLDVAFWKGKEVSRILPGTKEIVLTDGQRESYDTILIASGSHAMEVRIKGLEQDGYHVFHTLGDCRRLQKELATKQQVTIYGGGLVAVELLIALIEAGYPARLVVRSRILRRYLDLAATEIMKDILTSHGAQIYEGHTIDNISKSAKQLELSLSEGKTISTDLLLVALGVKPVVEFIDGTGIKANEGIVVDHRMQTSVADIYAAGDVAEAPGFFTGEYGMNQIIKSAVEEGKVAGANMAGYATEYQGWISSNMFNFLGNSAFSAGQTMMEGDSYEVLTEKDTPKHQYKKMLFDGNRLAGVMTFNIDLDPGVMLYLIEKKLDISQYKQWLFEQPKEVGRWLMSETEQKEAAPLSG